jgi:hypothetical protein
LASMINVLHHVLVLHERFSLIAGTLAPVSS